MADILRIKRRVSGAPGAPASLANAELAYNEVDHILYYGEGTGGGGGSASVIVPIAGPGLASGTNPIMDGVAAPGVSSLLSRGDHVHPSDTTKAGISGTPSAAQIATWASATTIQGVAPSSFSISAWGVPTADVPWNSKKITGLLDPTGPQDAATKNYVDNMAQGIDAKASVRVASTVNIAALTGLLTVDGIVTVAGDRVLVKDQSAPAANGIYVVAAGAWVRATDMDAWGEFPAAYVFVEVGTTNADSGWLCTVDAGGTLGTTAVTWTQFSGAGSVTAGAGLTKTGNTLDVVGTTNRITVAADSIDISTAYVGQTSITTLGTIGTGTWNATIITVPKGGTGVATLTGYVKGNGAAVMTAAATIPNTDITGLGTMSTQNANAVAITGGTIDGITFDMGTF